MKNRKKNPKSKRIKQSPLKSDATQQVFFYIAKGHHVKYATVLGGVELRTFNRWLQDAKEMADVKYATPEEQEEFLREYQLANALYIDGRVDTLNTIREGNLNPSVFKQLQWELAVKDRDIYSQNKTTQLEIKQSKENPLLGIWQSILNDEDNQNEESE